MVGRGVCIGMVRPVALTSRGYCCSVQLNQCNRGLFFIIVVQLCYSTYGMKGDNNKIYFTDSIMNQSFTDFTANF